MWLIVFFIKVLFTSLPDGCNITAFTIPQKPSAGPLSMQWPTGIKEAIAAAYPKTEYQRCLVHQERNTLKYVADKDRKGFAKDLKTIYNAASETAGREALDAVKAAWDEKYPER